MTRARSVVRSLRHRAVYAPVLLCAAVASLSSVTSRHSLGLLAASAFAAHEVSAELVLADTAVRGAGHNKWSNIKHIKAERDGQLAKVSIALDNYM